MSIYKHLAKKLLHQRKLKPGKISNLIKLNKDFQAFPPFSDIKLFEHYNKIIRWIRKKQKK